MYIPILGTETGGDIKKTASTIKKSTPNKSSQTVNDCVFDMDGSQHQAQIGDLKSIKEDEPEPQEDHYLSRPASVASGKWTASSAAKNTADNTDAESSVFECDRASLNSTTAATAATTCGSSKQQHTNISTTAFSTFVRLIQSLGPVLTSKYCCSDLFKMLAISYMNSRCLNLIETSGEFY